jgi:hypothetical protein
MNVIPWKQAARQEMYPREPPRSPVAAESVQEISSDETEGSGDEADGSTIVVQGQDDEREGPPRRKKRKTLVAATSSKSGL